MALTDGDIAVFSVHKLDARSHFPTIEVPDQVTGLVEQFVIRPE